MATDNHNTQRPRVRLTGTDGNVFALLGRCSQALRQAGQAEQARELQAKVMSAGSYDAALVLMMEYVEAS